MPFKIRRSIHMLFTQILICAGMLAGEDSTANTVQSELSEAETAELIVRSLGLLGVEYRFGGSTPAAGLDCSGFVRHVYKEALGLTLPRTTDEMSSIGEAVDRRQLRAGDLVFFNTLQRPFSHVGLYLGEDRFVHAPSTGNVIRIEPLSTRYWAQRFEGGRRISPSSNLAGQDRTGLDQLISTRGGDIAASSPKVPQLVSPRARSGRASETRLPEPRLGSQPNLRTAALAPAYLSNH